MDPFQHARQLYSEGHVHDALEVAQSACERQPRDPDGWWLLARISRHAGLTQASDVAFQRAFQLSDRHRPPIRVPRRRFLELVSDAGAAAGGSPVPSRIEAFPDQTAIASGTAPDALSNHGPRGARVLYQVNIENQCRDEAELTALLASVISRSSPPS